MQGDVGMSVRQQGLSCDAGCEIQQGAVMPWHGIGTWQASGEGAARLLRRGDVDGLSGLDVGRLGWAPG